MSTKKEGYDESFEDIDSVEDLPLDEDIDAFPVDLDDIDEE